MYFDRNATQSAAKRQFSRWGGGSGGMHRRSNAAWVSPQAASCQWALKMSHLFAVRWTREPYCQVGGIGRHRIMDSCLKLQNRCVSVAAAWFYVTPVSRPVARNPQG